MSMVTGTKTNDLLVERRGAVLVLTFNRPERRNAMSLASAQRMVEGLEELDADDMLGAGVLTGAGGNFCSGMDLKAFLQGERPYVAGHGYGGLTEKPPRKPLIAAVEGYALAGGFEAALACDLIVASTTAKFGLPEVKRGLVAAAGGLLRLPRRIPYHIAMQYALTGDTNGPQAVRVSKRVVVESGDWATTEMFRRQASIVDPVFPSAEAQEGVRAFAERRAPRWSAS